MDLYDIGRDAPTWPREAAAVEDGRLNFIEIGVAAVLAQQPGRRACIDKLWLIGGGRERSGPSMEMVRHACRMLSNLGYVSLQGGMVELME